MSPSSSPNERRTGAWMAKTRIGYVTSLEGSGVTYGDAESALVWPTKVALRKALKGVIPRGESYEIERASAAEWDQLEKEDRWMRND